MNTPKEATIEGERISVFPERIKAPRVGHPRPRAQKVAKLAHKSLQLGHTLTWGWMLVGERPESLKTGSPVPQGGWGAVLGWVGKRGH